VTGIDVGDAKKAKAAAASNGVNVAAMIREMELLRDVAEKAIRLRAVGRACDKIDEALDELWRNNPEMTKSATQAMMARQAFETAMSDFDQAVVRAVEAGMTWAPIPPRGPRDRASS
jgi:uncharacterized protein YoxC